MQGVKGEAVVVLRRALDNAADAVSSAFPKGKQHDCFSWFSGSLTVGSRIWHNRSRKQ
jgi:hypothetical protein